MRVMGVVRRVGVISIRIGDVERRKVGRIGSRGREQRCRRTVILVRDGVVRSDDRSVRGVIGDGVRTFGERVGV